MAIMFEARDPDERMNGILATLERAREPRRVNAAYVTRAMYGLIGIEVGRQAGLTAAPEDEARFYKAVARECLRQINAYRGFQGAVWTDALNAANDGWYHASLGRSVYQIIMDRFDAEDVAALIDMEEVEEIDGMLRDAAPDSAPVFSTMIPPGLPPSHWWWHLPSGEPEIDYPPF